MTENKDLKSKILLMRQKNFGEAVSEPNEKHGGTKEDGTKYRYRKIVRNTNALDSNPQDENEISKVGTKKYEAAIKKGVLKLRYPIEHG